jgi:hypothetical protein
MIMLAFGSNFRVMNVLIINNLKIDEKITFSSSLSSSSFSPQKTD